MFDSKYICQLLLKLTFGVYISLSKGLGKTVACLVSAASFLVLVEIDLLFLALLLYF